MFLVAFVASSVSALGYGLFGGSNYGNYGNYGHGSGYPYYGGYGGYGGKKKYCENYGNLLWMRWEGSD